jgi:predicted Zn-dependent protease
MFTQPLRYFFIVSLCLSSAIQLRAERKEPFTFGKVDLELLKQTQLVDQKYQKDGMTYHDEALEAYMNQVGRSMLPAGVDPERVKWSFHVLRDPTPNAMALPNGSIYVHTGLLSLLENEDQLASVLAHEITHVTDRHMYLEYHDYRTKTAIANIASYVSTLAPGASAWGAAIQVAGTIVPVIMAVSINGYSRELEKDADIYAFNKLIEGGYDPREMPNTFRLLERTDEVDLRTIYYDNHPQLEDRIRYISSLIRLRLPDAIAPEVLAERKMRYQTLTENVSREDIRLALLSHHPRIALARATKLVELHPNNPDDLYSRAEAYRSLGPWTPRPTNQELSEDGKRDARNLRKKFTPGEEERQLLSKESGQAAWKENQRLAEDDYREALSIKPSHAKSQRGLGELFEGENRYSESVAAYQQYLELQPNGLDRYQIQQRIEMLQRRTSQ